MKQTANLHIVCQPSDIARLDHQRGHFHASPPEREDLALALMRYASAKVERQPWLLSLICRLFGEATDADVDGLDGPVIGDELRADIRACAAVRRKGEQDAFDYITNVGRTHGRLSGWQDGRRGL